MSRPRQPLVAIVVSVLLLLVSCGDSTFARDDAVVALQDAGATTVEAGCMADTLRALGLLEAARPGREMTAESRSALLQARDRCAQNSAESVQAAVGGVTVTRAESLAPSVPQVSVEAPDPSLADVATGTAQTNDPLVRDAIDHLMALGRPEAWATCVADQLFLVDAVEVLESPTLGLGGSPEEATAIVLCS